ncbi:hypothetical protein FRX31_025359 [Thalictrum thalictroides]|uniref:Uncharacterized protein n=1 Tax=Thalictrum thalictroides TaxID=46969 RepID=A0A7J6VLK8_THATH|nr:hypothetical protein FRX31_025359 [Thalictrum thalictroides]
MNKEVWHYQRPKRIYRQVANHNSNVAGSSGAKNALGQEINSPTRKDVNPFNVLSVVEEDNNDNSEDKVGNNASEKDKAQSGNSLENNSFGVLQQSMENEEKDDVSINVEEEECKINTDTTEEGLFWDEEPTKATSSEHQGPITDNMECSSPTQVTPLAIEGPPIQSPISGIQISTDTLQNLAILPANQEALGTSPDPFLLTNGEEENSDSEEEGEDNTEDICAYNSDSEITKKSKHVPSACVPGLRPTQMDPQKNQVVKGGGK